jgi:NAD(P)-dependent dehydrogenase (short-subunit alcohol dehydrogenase family)
MGALQGLKAIITGGSSGIGQAIAIAFAGQGCDIVFSYSQNKSGADNTTSQIESLGQRGWAIQADMNNSSDLEKLIEEGTTKLGGLDIFVNNAGTITRHADFLDIPIESFETLQNVNLRAPFLLTQLAARYMRDKQTPGSIINISSISARLATAGITHYECSKAALNALTRGAAKSLAPYSIRVNAIEPGLVETNMNQDQRTADGETWARRANNIPLQRVGQPDDIAQVALMLASPQAQWMTGSTITVDGGNSVR